MSSYLWIALGSALGGMFRHWCAMTSIRLWPIPLPWGTIAINILGSFVIGFFASLTDDHGRYPLPVTARQFVMVGLCGGYTTFSSFSLQTLTLLRGGLMVEALLNIGLSVMLCLAAVAFGHWLAVSMGTR